MRSLKAMRTVFFHLLIACEIANKIFLVLGYGAWNAQRECKKAITATVNQNAYAGNPGWKGKDFNANIGFS
ncbi:MAG TPA: hypothetical protein VF268_03010 [Gammaproteobacteria bacterium]